MGNNISLAIKVLSFLMFAPNMATKTASKITTKPKTAGLFFINLAKAKAPGDLLLSNDLFFG
jgi:hypothetical protein